MCYWYNKGDYLDKERSKLYFDSDPINAMTVLWLAAPEAPGGGITNFGLSYEVTKVKNAFTAETQTTAACDGNAQDCITAFKVYRGATIVHRTKWASNSGSHAGKQVDTMVSKPLTPLPG